MDEGNYFNYLGRGTILTTLALIFSGLGYLGLKIILARVLTPQEFGSFFAVVALVSVLSVLRNFGTNTAIAKFLPDFLVDEKKEKARSAFFTTLFLQTIFALSITLILILLSRWFSLTLFETPQYQIVIIILSIWFFVKTFFEFLKNVFRGTLNIGYRSVVEISEEALTLIFVLIFILIFNATVILVSIAYFLGTLLASVSGFFILKNKSKFLFSNRFSFSKPLAKRLLKFGFPLFIASLSASALFWTDTLIISIFWNASKVGIYQVAHTISFSLAFLGTGIGIPLLPIFSKVWKEKEKEKSQSFFQLLAKISLAVIIPVSVILLLFPNQIILLLFGQSYLSGTTALRILTIAATIGVLSAVFRKILSGAGHPIKNMKSLGAAAVLNVSLNIFLVPTYGLEGGAIATLVSIIFGFLLLQKFTRQKLEFSLPLLQILKLLIGGGIIIIIGYGLSLLALPIWVFFTSLIVFSVSFHLVWIGYMRILKKDELEILEKTFVFPNRIAKIWKKLSKE